MTAFLSVDNVYAGYGESVVLNGVSFTLGAGETLALLGRNGTGKTTLMDTLVGATRQHSGKISLNGLALHTLASHERAGSNTTSGIGWVPQERNIFKSLTVHENLTAVARSVSHVTSNIAAKAFNPDIGRGQICKVCCVLGWVPG